MSGEWQESLQRTIRLPEDESKIFAIYHHWLYYGTLPVFCDEPGLSGNAEYLDLVKAYTLGNKFLDSRFQDAVIDAIFEKSVSKAQDGKCWYPVGEAIEYAYSYTAESALIRELFVDMYVCHGHRDWLHSWAEPSNVPRPFLLELASRLLDQRDGIEPKIIASKYHIHSSNDGKI